ncbi:ornithine cyclodeaminase [Hoeflea marina]|uniref:Ornithine cyclodeaminase n=1 Tax=Hoeflea marina TaxID=274592 RepID=A0A317PMF8_9HYPH|nr:ornithine cyclodeaminase family protein [Hoeflea marina]PWW01947.1 ornithine cyclodeaminase [Hoeflea marina]
MSRPSPIGALSASRLLTIDGATVGSLVGASEAIELAATALMKTSSATAVQDVRRTLDLPGEPGTCLSLMYASLGAGARFGAKVQSVFPANFRSGLPSHQGGVLLFEAYGGRPVAFIDAHAITGIRTAAASSVATRALARPEACRLAVLGYGEQAERHIASLALVRPITHIRVWGRDPGKAARFAEAQCARGFHTEPVPNARDAVRDADIVCTVTSSSTPVLQGEWLPSGCHVNAVGASIPALREIDLNCVIRSRIWVDYMPMAMSAASDIYEPLANGLLEPSRLVGEIGAVLNGACAGRTEAGEITLFRSLGVPAQDIELADYIYCKARDLGLGTEINM